MNKKIAVLSTMVGLLTFAPPAFAVTLYCTGTIEQLYVDTSNRLYVYSTWRSSYTMVCDLDATWKGVPPGVCKNWFGMLQAAYHAQSPVIIQYSGITEPSCATLLTYTSAPGPQYVMNY